MAKHAYNPSKMPINRMAGELRRMTEIVGLEKFDLLTVKHSTVSRCDILVQLSVKLNNRIVEKELNLLVFRFTDEGNMALPSEKSNFWVVQQNFIYKVSH